MILSYNDIEATIERLAAEGKKDADKAFKAALLQLLQNINGHLR
jgi:hypothetical protein